MDSDSFNINNRIIVKCLEGDIKAQFMLYKNYSAAMYNIAVRITGNKMDAEDVLQESFVTVFEKMPELENINSFGSWLKRIVINNSISLIRKRKAVFGDLDEFLESNEDLPEEVDEGIDPAIVHEAIKILPDGSRTVLVLYALEGYKHREISEMLGITESTSKSQYRRALGLLNKNLKNRIYAG
jgi:RNA polymerase sigma-70 factor (ECF subfamily)